MKTVLFFFITTLSLYAAAPTIYMAPPASTTKIVVEGQHKETKKALPQTPLSKIEQAATAKHASTKGATEMMIISPEGRAKDIEAAIKFLKQKAPTNKPTIKLTNGATISGIVDINVMPGGTLLIFQIASLKGLQYQIEKIENIAMITANGT